MLARTGLLAAALTLILACGRIGYDARAVDGDGDGDADGAAGGPACTGASGTCVINFISFNIGSSSSAQVQASAALDRADLSCGTAGAVDYVVEFEARENMTIRLDTNDTDGIVTFGVLDACGGTEKLCVGPIGPGTSVDIDAVAGQRLVVVAESAEPCVGNAIGFRASGI